MSFDQQALIRSVAINPDRYMLLLGAGASASSGVPTGSECIWLWKREIFLSNNPGVTPAHFGDISLPFVQDKVQRWLDSQGTFPSHGCVEEYAYYIEKCYPRPEDRVSFFQKRLTQIIPQVGYQFLAMLQNAGAFRWTWTTNFDGLVRQARRPEHAFPLREVGLDTSFRLHDVQDSIDGGYLIALHGDYRYDRLQNTSAEVQQLNHDLCSALIARVKKQPLVVIGYGGRDESVMQALETAFQSRCEGGAIYWCVLPSEKVNGRIQLLIESARSNNYEAELVEIEGFDDLMIRLSRHIFRSGPQAAEIETALSGIAPERSAFQFVGYSQEDDWIKSNAYPLELPRELYQFEVKDLSSWKQLKEIVHEHPIVAGLLQGKVLAIADAAVISKAFGSRLASRLELVPLSQRDYVRSESVTVSILMEALRRSIAESTGLTKFGKRGVYEQSCSKPFLYDAQRYKVFDAVSMHLSFQGNRHFLNLLPDIYVTTEDGTEASKEVTKEAKRQLLTKQYNQQYDDALHSWSDKILAGEDTRAFTYPNSSIDSFRFKVSVRPALARIVTRSRSTQPPSPNKPGEVFQAAVLSEPLLVFGAKGAFRPKHPHPLRGVVKDGPYDLGLTLSGNCHEVRTGVICPNGHEGKLQNYLNKLVMAHAAVESNQEYLIPYPGFQQAYRIPLAIPQLNDPEWRRLPTLQTSGLTKVQIQKLIAAAVSREIDALAAVASVDVVVILVPSAWQAYEVVEDENQRLDLRNFIKAHCAQKGVRTQFLREATISKSLQCEVLWWLAQALYVKALRTPFILDNNDPDTVFVGIGYGMSRVAEDGVVLGCSHIYDAAGQGLRYQLSRIQKPVWINKNPFLNKDDAIRVGYQTRQLFYQTYQRLPRRVVIHKRTHFTKDEREGLAQALSGIPELEMITIEFEDAWRFVAYNKFKQCTDMFPVKRNTVMLYGEHQCLLWVHGSVKGVAEGNLTYYKGKSRIPAPLRITRFSGRSSLETISTEILGLSKMDWNNGHLYGKLPATLESSSAIASVGQLLTRFGPETYDYRLFM